MVKKAREPRLGVSIGKLAMKNPVAVASGTFGYADEFSAFMDLGRLGAIVTKTVTLKARKGNPAPRTCETAAGMLNAIGLENPGISAFIEEKLPFLRKTGVPVVMSIASEGPLEEFLELAAAIDPLEAVAAIEINISCPNVSGRGKCKLVSQDPKLSAKAVSLVRKATSKPLITKLSPNVTDIAEIARAVEGAGSDAVSLINTLSGMAIDLGTRRPKLGNVFGGLSGPAIKPVALRMVWEVFNAVKVPVVAMGGIMDARDALEFIVCGASCVCPGTANFINPSCAVEIIDGIRDYCVSNGIADINELKGSLKL
jgi:dihydroorotate dehydrogenase (NAD+) catalytic subunit